MNVLIIMTKKSRINYQEEKDEKDSCNFDVSHVVIGNEWM